MTTSDIMFAPGFPRWSPMKSGTRALVLQPCTVSEFAESAARWIDNLGLQLVSEGITSDGATAMMTVTYGGARFWLATDTWLNELALEPQSADGEDPAAVLFEILTGKIVTMFRPAGPKELELVAASGWRRWPPRLPEQPIFYPVTNQEYAEQIARDWNVPESGAGFVLRFNVRREFTDRFEVHKVGGEMHTEWWIPAENLEELNDNIVGTIDVVARFPSEDSNPSRR